MNSNTKTLLDRIIRELCSERGDNYGHTWFYNYQHAVAWLREMDNKRGGVKECTYVWLPVVNGRAQVPDVTGIARVGVVIDGHIVPLLEDLNMVDRPGDCGELSDTRPVNPDIPAMRVTSQFPTLYTGQSNTGPSYLGHGWWESGSGLQAGLLWADSGYFPGSSLKKSLYGYYRHFTDLGYILLDASSNWTEIVIECSTKSYVPGRVTLVNDIAIESLKAYVRYKLSCNKIDVSTKERPIYRIKSADNALEAMRLRQRLGRQPLVEYWAACQ